MSLRLHIRLGPCNIRPDPLVSNSIRIGLKQHPSHFIRNNTCTCKLCRTISTRSRTNSDSSISHSNAHTRIPIHFALTNLTPGFPLLDFNLIGDSKQAPSQFRRWSQLPLPMSTFDLQRPAGLGPDHPDCIYVQRCLCRLL